MKRNPHGKEFPVVFDGRQLDNGRYRMAQCHIGRTGLEGEGTAIGMAVSQGKYTSKHNEVSRLGSIAWSEMALIQYKMANADCFVEPVGSDGSKKVNPRHY